MKLGTKLLLAPLLTGVIALSGGAVNALLASREASSNAEAFHGNLETLRTIGLAKEQLGTLHAGVYRSLALMASLDEAAVAAFRKDLKNQVEGIVRVSSGLAAPAGQGDQLPAQLDQVAQALAAYGKQADNAIDMASVDPNTGVAAMQNADASFQKASTAMAAIVTGMGQAADAAADASAQRAQRNTLALLAASLVATGITLALCALMLRRVMAAVRQARQVAEAVAQGDLAVAVDTDRPDEIGDLQRALGQMTRQLGASLQTVQQVAQHIAGASAEIASGNQDLSGRTEQTASSLQQASSSLVQLTGGVRQTADAASEASGLASSAAGVARRGGEVVGQVVTTMDEINQASKRIADIIGTIDGIAFQTNILALNAAVEAARAGEQGRGFAVVASEVRSLAQRSAAAAREIKALIGNSVDKVEAGARLVQAAGATMAEIVASVERVTSVIGEISTAAAEQSGGIGQVSSAVGSLDDMTQQNAALVEQSASAAEQLSEQARTLTGTVARFRIAA